MAAEGRAYIIVVGSRAADTQAANHRVGVAGDTREEAQGLAKRNSLFFFFSPKGGEVRSAVAVCRRVGQDVRLSSSNEQVGASFILPFVQIGASQNSGNSER